MDFSSLNLCQPLQDALDEIGYVSPTPIQAQAIPDLIVQGMEGAISAGTVTYDFERLMDDATLLKCSEFGAAIIAHM